MTWTGGEAVFVAVMGIVALAALAWWLRDDEPRAPQAAPIPPPMSPRAPPDDLDEFERVVEQARRRLPKGIADELDRRQIAIVVADESPDAPEALATYLHRLRTVQIYRRACEAHTNLPLDEVVFRVLCDQATLVIPELDREAFRPLFRDPA